MTIFRTQHNKNYTVVNNTIIKDTRISWKAKGIWLYAFSRPDDWVFHINDLINQSTDGRDAVRSGLNELEKTGYLRKPQKREKDGKFGHAEWVFHETPLKEILPETENPHAENHPLPMTDSLPYTEGNVLGDDETLPFESNEKEKRTKAKYPLKKNQQKIFQELKSLNLETNDDTLIILIRSYPQKQLTDCICHMKNEISKGTKFKKSKIAFFRFLLSGNVSVLSEQAIQNKKKIEQFKELHNIFWLEIHEKYCLCKRTQKEVPFDLSEKQFDIQIQSLIRMGKDYA